MRFECSRATVLALAELLRVADAAWAGPVSPTLALRAILAQLHEASGADRALFDRLWRAVQDPVQHQQFEDNRNYIRGTMARACWTAVARGCGFPDTVEALHRMEALGVRLDANGDRGEDREEDAMCNRYRMTAKQAELSARYGVEAPYPADLTIPPPELFPKKPAWVVRSGKRGRVLDVMDWGFPHQVPGKRINKATGKPVMLEKQVTNVRNLSSPFWRSALVNSERRCLVPFTAFSEYGQVRGGDGKLPLHWFDVPSRPIVSFAGVWRPIEGGAVFAFLTTEPNAIIAPIHPKAMPVLLHDEDEAAWLNAPIEEALALVAPYPSQLMRVA